MKAFTLVELLVVITIISLLLAMLTPVLNNVKETSRLVTCKARLSVTGSSMILYAQDNNGCYVPRACGHSYDAAACGCGGQMPPGYSYTFVNGDNTTIRYIYLGKYWEQEYIEPENMFCPSATAGFDYQSQFVESTEVYGKPKGRTSFFYRLGITDCPNSDPPKRFYRILDVNAGARVLVFDKASEYGSNYWHGTKQNALYGNGSVKTLEEEDLSSVMYYTHWDSSTNFEDIRIAEMEDRY